MSYITVSFDNGMFKAVVYNGSSFNSYTRGTYSIQLSSPTTITNQTTFQLEIQTTDTSTWTSIQPSNNASVAFTNQIVIAAGADTIFTFNITSPTAGMSIYNFVK